MQIISVIIAVFAFIGIADKLAGNKFGIGKEFDNGLKMFGSLALSMIGMIVLVPLLQTALTPMLTAVYNTLNVDPSLVTSLFIANDMGAAHLAKEIAMDKSISKFCGLIVASTMGATVSFTIPFALQMVNKEKYSLLLLGILCGIVTIPFGCFAAGLIAKININLLVINLLPLFVFSAVIAVGIIFIPNICIKIFNVLGIVLRVIIAFGLGLGIVKYLTGYEIIKGLGSFESGAEICVNIAVVMTGIFPLLYIISKLFAKPINKFGKLLKINESSALGFISSLATSVNTFNMMDKMDDKGIVLNSAFAVSAAFVFADHLAFTLSFDKSYVLPVVAGKLICGITAVIFAAFAYKLKGRSKI